MRKIFGLIYLSIFCIACENKPGIKGDIIPPQTILKNPINAVKTIKYLSALIEEDETNQLYFLRAKAYYDLHDYTSAYKDIEKAIKGGSDDQDYLFLSASIKYQLEWYDLAIEDLKLLSSSDFNAEKLNELYGQIYLSKKDVKKANYFLAKLARESYRNTRNLILNRICKGDSLNVLIELNNSPALSEESTFLTRFYFENYRPSKLDVAYQYKLLKILKKYPSDPHLMRFWARYLFSIHQIDRAEKVYFQVEKLLPNNPLLAVEIGEFYFKLRNYKKALDYFSKVPRNTPSYSKALVFKSICWVYKGDKLSGLQTLDSLKKFYPNEKYLFKLFDRYTNHRFDSLARQTDSLRTQVNQN